MTLDPKKLEDAASALYQKIGDSEHPQSWQFCIQDAELVLRAYGVPELEARAARVTEERDAAIREMAARAEKHGRLQADFDDLKNERAADSEKMRLYSREAAVRHDECYSQELLCDELRQEIATLKAALKAERDAIFYAMTRGQHYDIGLAKERMTAALKAEKLHDQIAETDVRLESKDAEIDALKAELARFQWRPIEEAPKDGTEILAVIAGNHPTSGRPFISLVVEFDGHLDCFIKSGHEPNDDYDIRRCKEWSDKLTHFMPLPAPPPTINPRDSAPALIAERARLRTALAQIADKDTYGVNGRGAFAQIANDALEGI